MKLCAPTADITGRPVPTAVSVTPVRFVCADLQNLFCQRTFAAKLVCRDFDVLINQNVTTVCHTCFVCSSQFVLVHCICKFMFSVLCTVFVSLFPLCYFVYILLCCCSFVILYSLFVRFCECRRLLTHNLQQEFS